MPEKNKNAEIINEAEKKKKKEEVGQFNSINNGLAIGQANLKAKQQVPNSYSVSDDNVKTEYIIKAVNDFPGRSKEKYGVGERINLSVLSTDMNYQEQMYTKTLKDFTTTNDQIKYRSDSDPLTDYNKDKADFAKRNYENKHPSSQKMGGFQWEATGGGTFDADPNNTGTTVYTAPEMAASVTLSLKNIKSGKIVHTKNIQVVEPNAGYVSRNTTYPLWHIQGRVSAGFFGKFFIGPKDVSFSAVRHKEGECAANLSGGFTRYGDLRHHPNLTPAPVAAPTSVSEGSRVAPAGGDRAQHSYPAGATPMAGTMTWNIPWSYMLGHTDKQFAIVEQHAEADDAGTMSLSKDGSGTFSQELNAPTFNQEPYQVM